MIMTELSAKRTKTASESQIPPLCFLDLIAHTTGKALPERKEEKSVNETHPQLFPLGLSPWLQKHFPLNVGQT